MEGAELARELDDSGVKRVEVPEASKPWQLTHEARRMFDDLLCDVLHLHGAFSPQNNLILRRVEIPTVLSPHGVYSPESLAHSKWVKRIFRRFFELPSLRKVDVICGLTEGEADDVRAFGFEGRIEVIPNGVAKPLSGLDRGSFRRRLGMDPGELLGLFVGRIDLYHKRIDEVARAVAGAPGWHLAVVGPDYRGGQNQLQALVDKLDGGERVHIVGSLRGRELGEAYVGSDVFLLLSRFEGMSMSLLEAMSHGVPAVISPGVEQALPVAASGAGWQREPSNLPELLHQLTVNPEQLNSAKRRAPEFVAGYQWDAVAAAYEDLYSSLQP